MCRPRGGPAPRRSASNASTTTPLATSPFPDDVVGSDQNGFPMPQPCSGREACVSLPASQPVVWPVCDDGVSDDAVDIRVPRAAEQIICVVWGGWAAVA